MKSCKRCLEEKPLDLFDIQKVNKDGRDGTCKVCRHRLKQEKIIAMRLEGGEKLKKWRAYRCSIIRKYRAEGRVKPKKNPTAAFLKWAKKNPEKRRAHRKVEWALKSGRIKKMDCHCGKPGQAHHFDYSKPLHFEWLCPFHHAERHKTPA